MAALPVLNNVDEQRRIQIAKELEALAPGQVRFGRHDQMLYATDASIYQVAPLGVVVPKDAEAMVRVVEYCGRKGVPLLPRGGGTSLPGQCTNEAVVLDHSAFCRGISGVNVERRVCHVEAGATVDEVNRELAKRGTRFFYAPDPATAAQATIGGCIGNNAAGARSLRYGRTSENVAGVEVVLTNGRRMWLEAGAGGRDENAMELARRVEAVVGRYAKLIRERFPKTLRRNAGYGLDLILAQMDKGIRTADLDLSGLICGSEGTLAVVLGAKLKLHPMPRSKGLAIVSYGSVEEALEAVVGILGTGPSAVELLDDVVLNAARGNAECRGYMDLMAEVGGEAPRAILYVEYQEMGGAEDVQGKFAALRGLLAAGTPVREHVDQKAILRAWALRKNGEPLLHGLASHRKPVTCVEDNAVPVERLVEFVAKFKEIVGRHGTRAAYYAHASVGVLHVRPMLDLHDAGDLERLQAIAMEVADLAKACGGVMSGEHGDGRLRGPLLERFYGPELMRAFREIKDIFDPAGVLNPGNIVEAAPLKTMTEHLRVAPEGRALAWPEVETYFDYSDQEGFSGAVEMCNGAGVCRKTAGGAMCPSYRATLDERHSTRGRGNALRLAITGQSLGEGGEGASPWNDAQTLETLSLCLSCKACKTECPSNVDMSRLKAEYLAQGYKAAGKVPLRARVLGNIRILNAMGAIMPRIANTIRSIPLVRRWLGRLLHLAPERSLPYFSESLYRWFEKRIAPPASGRPSVVLFGDCFTTYNETEIGLHAVNVMERLGYQVALPRTGCCGRSMISMGLLPDAIGSADQVLEQLKPFILDDRVRAIIVCEPSCLSAMKDDWLQLKLKSPRELRQKLVAKAMLIEEFIEKFWNSHPIAPTVNERITSVIPQLLFHGHCHQKALWGESASAAALRRLVGDRVAVLPSGCCGMAGSFGYDASKYALSMKIGEQSLFSHLGDASGTVLVASGTSCRHQVRDGIGRHSIHPAKLFDQLLTEDIIEPGTS